MYILWIILLSLPALAVDSDLCDLIDLPNCRGITKQLRRNTFQSAPNSSTATNINPANLRFDKGLGLEGMFQPGNAALLGLVSGTGKMGGAMISGSLDNSFFGNRVPEHKESIIHRAREDKQFKNEKLTLALGAKLFSQRRFGLDVGVFAKRHNLVKKINPGAGLSMRFWNFHFGASVFKDDFDLDMKKINADTGLLYSAIYGQDKLQETFTVTTLTGGFRYKSLAFDVASLSNDMKFYQDQGDAPPTRIMIYGISYYYGDFLLNVALRKETSGAAIYKTPDTIEYQKEKSATFLSLQYSLGKHLVFGLHYNYFLLEEVSGSMALFF